MAEIHDQFDTILILDFGSQVRVNSLVPEDLTKDSTVRSQNLVQPPDHKTVPRAQRLRRTSVLHPETERAQIQAKRSV